MGRTQPLEMVRVSMGPDLTYPGWKDSEAPATWLGLCRVEVFGPSSCPSKDPRGLLEAGNWSLAVIWGLQGERCGGGGSLSIKPGSTQPAVEFLL